MRRVRALSVSALCACLAGACGGNGAGLSEPACADGQEYAITLSATGLSAFDGRQAYVMTSMPRPRCRADDMATVVGGALSLTLRNRFKGELAVYPSVAVYVDRDGNGACDGDPAFSTITTAFADRPTRQELTGNDFDDQNATACALFPAR